MKHHKSFLAAIAYMLTIICVQFHAACSQEYLVTRPDADFKPPSIVLQHDVQAKSGMDWNVLSKLKPYSQDSNKPVMYAVKYLQEAVQRMTGKELPITSDKDLSHGIVLILLQDAPSSIKNDPKVLHALQKNDEDAYNAVEAFYVLSEPERVVIVANTSDGIVHGVVELLESVGYEVLGMGPNWTHVPDFKNKPLVFNLESAGRPGLYNRKIWATSAQDRGNGTLLKVSDAADEPVEESYRRWQIGTRIIGRSIPQVGGHSMQAYHNNVSEKMKAEKTTDGFLTEKTSIGLDSERPAASAENKGTLWINTDIKEPAAGKVYISVGDKWTVQNPREYRASLDLSVPMVRYIVLDDLKARAKAGFEKNPDEMIVFGADPEDGSGYTNLGKLMKNPNWYPDYLKKEDISFGQPYKLNGFKGLDQPYELWDPNSQSDTVFGFANWLGREYDKWIDSLPPAERITASGQDKKKLLTIGLLSYNFYDVPPNFNIDQRIRVKISAFPKHRGCGKWKNFASGNDMAEAFQVLLPQQPSDVGWYFSNAAYSDQSLNSIGMCSALPQNIQQRVAEAYRVGFRGIGAEMDFNFGRLGLAYYLYTKMLWNPHLSAVELSAIRDRWLQRAFGSGWKEMQQYYEFMAPQNFTVNGPNNWAKAIRFITSADEKINAEKEPDAQRRLDDLKQYWYFFYLLDSEQTKPPSTAFKEFVWKGQMSYMTSMSMVVKRFFNTKKVETAIEPEFRSGPAHYTHKETQTWWSKVLDYWKVTSVSEFKDAILVDGTRGSAVDVNDLIPIAKFQSNATNSPFCYNGYQNSDMNFFTVATCAGEEIGFKLFWPWKPVDRFNQDRDLSYDISLWNPQSKDWDEVVDETMTVIHSQLVTGSNDQKYQLVEARYTTTLPGTYRVTVGKGGSGSQLTSLDYDLLSEKYSGSPNGFTYANNMTGHTQSAAWFYIPKGTKTVDLEVWDSNGKKQLTFYSGLPATGLKKGRVIEVGKRGTHVVKLEPGEDGSLVSVYGGGFYFPYLYSIPQLWAKSPQALLVPRSIALADGLIFEVPVKSSKTFAK